MTCPDCRAPVSPEDCFCQECGCRLEASEPTVAGQGTSAPIATGDSGNIAAVSVVAVSPIAVAADDPTAAPVPPGAVPVLEVCFGRDLGAGRPGILTCQLRNESSTAFRGDFEMTSAGLALDAAATVALEPGECATLDVGFTPFAAGGHVVAFQLSAPGSPDCHGRAVIDIPAAGSGPMVVNVTDARQNNAKFVVGQESHINVHVPGAEQTASALRMEEFVPVRWSRRGTAGGPVTLRSGGKRPFGLDPAAPRFRADKCSLRFRTETGFRNVCLVAKPCVTLGKQFGNDIVLRVLPESPENDALWSRISRAHAQIEFTEDGVVWRNLNCANGTFVEQTVVGPDEVLPIRSALVIRPANVLGLSCRLLRDDSHREEAAAYARFAASLGAESHAEHAGGRQALRLNRVGNLDQEEEYLLFQRRISVGSDPECGLFVPGNDVAATHAQIAWLAGSFWLEPLSPTKLTRVNGAVVPLHHLALLRPGAVIALGERELTVTEYQQRGIED